MARAHILSQLIAKYGFRNGAELGLADGATLFYLLARHPNLNMIGVDAYEASSGIGDKTSTGFCKYEQRKQNKVRDVVVSTATKYRKHCQLYIMQTVMAAELVQDSSLDFIFIDADHRTSFVRSDIAAWSPKVHKGGLITGHDWKFPSVGKVLNEIYGDLWTKDRDVWIVRQK